MKKILLVVIVLNMCASSLLTSQQRISHTLLIHQSTALHSDVMSYSVDSDGGQKKSVALAVVYSLIVPGMGQTYVGSFRTGKYYLFAEGGLWLTYAGFQMYGNWLHQDAQTFATEHAAANFDGKNDQFEVNIGNFNTTDDYNQAKLRNRQYDLLYTGSQYQWDWGGNDANRLQFKNIRIQSASVYDNSRFLIGAVVVNHLFSAFMAGRAAAAYNRSLASEQSWYIEALALGNAGNVHGIALSFTENILTVDMPNIRLDIEYDGTDFVGWQFQKNGRSVQEELEKAIRKIFQTEVRVHGGGRTDAGVHARGQVANILFDRNIEIDLLAKQLTAVLPHDVVVKKASIASGGFHARHSAKARRYRYCISRTSTALDRSYCWQVFSKLDIEEMRSCANEIRGEHDFQSFCKAIADVEHYRCNVQTATWMEKDQLLEFEITANRFLHGMVRALVGTMVNVGRGHTLLLDFKSILESKDRSKAGMSAPAQGLCLEEIMY